MSVPAAEASPHRPNRVPMWLSVGWTLTGLRSAVTGGLASVAVLVVTIWTLPQISSAGPLPIVRLAVLLSLIGAVVRWLLAALALLIGSGGVLVGGLLSQVAVVYLAITIDPGVSLHGGVAVPFVVAVVMATVSALVGWLAYAGSNDAYLSEVLRAVRRQARRVPAAPTSGLLMVQLDGLSAPLLRWMVMSGNLPHLGGWIRDGSHSMTPWDTGVPSTTPASQAGILHGAAGSVPAFRWYDKDAGRIVVTNRVRDAADLEAGFAPGRGLLAGGGVSIGNVFSGDARTSLLVFSRAGLPHRRIRGWSRFFGSPQGVARGLVLTLAEIVKELHQGRRQRRRHVSPRVRRHGRYVVLLAVINVLLRDLNVALIAEQLARGVPAIYVNFVDYDEIAHHAGPTRPEALQTLEGLDRVLGALRRIIDLLPHDYRIVVVSDHGQSQGAPFRQRYGVSLTEVVDGLVDEHVVPVDATGRAEVSGSVNALLTELRLPARSGPRSRVAERPEIVVTASGNLAMIYLAAVPGRVPLEELARLHPRLVSGLASHPGIGFVVVDTVADGPVAIGAAGSHVLRTGRVDGTDPLLRYGDNAATALLRHAQIPGVGDVVVVSRLDEHTHEVAAFEELVGSHGGIGGWQTDAVLVHPAQWQLDDGLFGADAVHEVLLGWRAGLAAPGGAPADRTDGGYRPPIERAG